MQALRLHAMNLEEYPRFYRGRYRLGMSLEMIANPEFKLNHDEDASILCEGLHILKRCQKLECSGGGCKVEAGKPLPDQLKKDLLRAARKELAGVRRQLTLSRVIWAMFWHRDERALRKPYWKLRERQSFHDGALVAELLVAVRQSLNREQWHSGAGLNRRRAKKAMRITAAITGDCRPIRELLLPGKWRSARRERRPGASAGSVRWLAWQYRTPSWQAAYNTACLYAALGQNCKPGTAERSKMVDRVITSLRRVVNDRDCEMERPWDWISHDPDLRCLTPNEFSWFLDEQKLRDYPMTKPAPRRLLLVPPDPR